MYSTYILGIISIVSIVSISYIVTDWGRVGKDVIRGVHTDSTYTVLTFPSNRTESTLVSDTSRQLSDVGYTVLTQYLHSQVIEQNLPLSLTRAGSCLMWDTQYLHSTYTVLTFQSNRTESTPVTDTSRQLSDVGFTVLTQYLHSQVIEQNLPLSLTRAGSCLMWGTQYLHSTYISK